MEKWPIYVQTHDLTHLATGVKVTGECETKESKINTTHKNFSTIGSGQRKQIVGVNALLVSKTMECNVRNIPDQL